MLNLDDDNSQHKSNFTDDTTQNQNICSDFQPQVEEMQAKRRLAITTNQKYNAYIDTLQKQIDTLNEQSEISQHIIDGKKTQLIQQNERLNSILNSLPTTEHLEEQYQLLQNILKDDISSPPSLYSQLQNLGLLYSGETIEVVPQRLQIYINRFNSYLNAIDDSNHNLQEEELELTKQIQILDESESISQIKVECAQIQNEIEQLKDEIDLLKRKSQTHQTFSESDICRIVENAGGDVKKLRKIRGKLFKYGTQLFTVEMHLNSIYAKTKETRMLLSVFIKTFIDSKTS